MVAIGFLIAIGIIIVFVVIIQVKYSEFKTDFLEITLESSKILLQMFREFSAMGGFVFLTRQKIHRRKLIPENAEELRAQAKLVLYEDQQNETSILCKQSK